jgi:hypothetical protein
MSYSRHHLVLGLPRLVRPFPPQLRPPSLPLFDPLSAMPPQPGAWNRARLIAADL